MDSNELKIDEILDLGDFNVSEKNFIEKAYLFAKKAHLGQQRNTGETYIQHPLHVAKILLGFGLDAQTLAAALLHDVPEDTNHSLKEIQAKFGREVAKLVDGVTKLGHIRIRKGFFFVQDKKLTDGLEKQTENLRKMILAMSKDVRVILIKLADRLHNMRTLAGVEAAKRRRISLETLEVYAPIANRLEMGELKGELEDLAFPYVYPNEYESLKRTARFKYSGRQKYVQKVIRIIKKMLAKDSIKIINIHGRAKHWYSLFTKLKKHEEDFSKIYDLVAVRIIVPTIADCYRVLGIIHGRWKPMRGRIKDYIAMPKANGYQSLHTTIFCEDKQVLEIQIRTPQMHQASEYGVAAHWRYNEAGKRSAQIQDKISWIKNLARLQKKLKDPKEFNKVLKTEFFSDRIFALTPQGEIKNLPLGATPVDFAYTVHSEVGHCCAGAKINGKIASLSTPLENGDVVEIITSKRGKLPNYDWLEFVKTSGARYHIKRRLKKEGRLA